MSGAATLVWKTQPQDRAGGIIDWSTSLSNRSPTPQAGCGTIIPGSLVPEEADSANTAWSHAASVVLFRPEEHVVRREAWSHYLSTHFARRQEVATRQNAWSRLVSNAVPAHQALARVDNGWSTSLSLASSAPMSLYCFKY